MPIWQNYKILWEFFEVLLEFDKILNLLWPICNAIGQIFIVTNGQMVKNIKSSGHTERNIRCSRSDNSIRSNSFFLPPSSIHPH